MTPSSNLLTGDCREILPTLPAESVHCVVTSPPYWGLRDYGVEGQCGLEPTPEAYVAELVAVFREVRRVLRPDGTLWLNLGDSFWSASATQGRNDGGRPKTFVPRGVGGALVPSGTSAPQLSQRSRREFCGLKPKDLVGIPWMVAFALRADGWYLRSDIIWAKPNPMPESVRDRPTKSHEYVFLFSKSTRYHYDAAAIAEKAITSDPRRPAVSQGTKLLDSRTTWRGGELRDGKDFTKRNARSVWTITPKPYAGAHFATFPPDLAERCVRAGTSEKGYCPHCGAPWTRVLEREPGDTEAHQRPKHLQGNKSTLSLSGNGSVEWANRGSRRIDRGWSPSCACPTADPVPATVLDPFAGAGTTLLVANRLRRSSIGIELNPTYGELARNRVLNDPEARRPAP